MKKLGILLISSIALLLIMSSCNKEPSGIVSDDVELENLVMDENEEYLFDWGIDEQDESNMFDGYSSFSPSISFPKLLDPIDNVVRFGRKINSRFRRQITMVRRTPDTALVSVTRELRGNFLIFEKLNLDPANPDTFALHRKPLRHIVHRKAIFVKRNSDVSDDLDRNRWRLQAVTLGQSESNPYATIRIHEIEIIDSQGNSTVLNDPLNTFLNIPDDIPSFTTGEEIHIKVLLENQTANPVFDPSGNGATETVLLHYGVNRFHRARKRFIFSGTDPNTGYNVYEGNWTIGHQVHMVRHAIVDAIDNGTIYDSDEITYPYNSTAWGAPYRVIQ
jgi:hypothetical protein